MLARKLPSRDWRNGGDKSKEKHTTKCVWNKARQTNKTERYVSWYEREGKKKEREDAEEGCN